MLSRREFIVSGALYAALSGVAISNSACAADNGYGPTLRTLRRPLNESAEHDTLLQELVRCATLAANGHNTQPCKFGLPPDAISIRPDLTRRTPVVDPDEHHLWVGLGCATEKTAKNKLGLDAAGGAANVICVNGGNGSYGKHFGKS